jgi:hypothetical protein
MARTRQTKRRKRKFPDGLIPSKMVDHVLSEANDICVVVGPLLWQPSDGTAAKIWYFIVATSEAGRGFRCDQITTPDGEADRTAFLLELIRRRPIIVHDMGDEVSMARLCEALWPGDRITAIRKRVEADYASRQQ